MSLTARERRNPPSRRKSCAACTKAKRRCDYASPACLRCSQRNIPCHYPPRRQVNSSPDVIPGWSSEDASSPLEDFSTVITNIDDNLCLLGPLDLGVVDENLDLAPDDSVLIPPSAKELSRTAEVVAERLQWSIDEIQKAPSTMVLENQTPWCHTNLYKHEMPRSMQDAHASCALYLAKNRVNAPIILRSIEARVNDLLLSPPPITPLDCLAHTQSLILYQIIRLFDGDISSRASAERAIPALEASAISLFAHVHFHFSQVSLPVTTDKHYWLDWILQESMRRTLLFTFYFLQAYRIMTGQRGLHCDRKLGLCHSWTLSAHLWSATSLVGFVDAWERKRHFVVTNAGFKEVLDEARPDDVDRFGRILISSLLGTDEAEAWFANRGGKL